MADPFDNRMLSVTFSLGGPAGFALKDVSIGSPPPLTAKPLPSDMVDNGHMPPLATIGLGAVAAVGVHALAKVIAHKRYTLEDGVLDALTGAALGSCFVGGHEAEAVCIGALSAIPMGLFSRLNDRTWDVRYGMLTQATLRLGVDLVGGAPVPFDGWRMDARGDVTLVPEQLVGNAAVDVGFHALSFALSNGAAAWLQKKEALPHVLIGAGYGGGTALLANVIMGAPFRPDPALLREGAADVAANGGADITDLMGHTLNRTAGLITNGTGIGAITLPGNIAFGPRHIGDASFYGHEYTHRDQFAGGYTLTGAGIVRPGGGVIGGYAEYLWGAAKFGYGDDPFEVEAYHYADGHGSTPAERTPPWGAFIGAGLLLGVYGVGTGLLDP